MSEYSESATARQAVQDWWHGGEFVPQHLREVASKPASSYVSLAEEIYSRTDIIEADLFNQVTSSTEGRPTYQDGYYASRMNESFIETAFEIGTNQGFDGGVPGEMFEYAASRDATATSYAHAIDLGARTLTLALWDNGEGHDFDRVAEIAEQKLGHNHLPREDMATDFSLFSARFIAGHALYSRGKVVFASGDQQMTLQTFPDYNLQRTDQAIEAIEGNVTLFQVPYFMGKDSLDYVRFHLQNAHEHDKQFTIWSAKKGRELTRLEHMIHNHARLDRALEQLSKEENERTLAARRQPLIDIKSSIRRVGTIVTNLFHRLPRVGLRQR